jgi:hypothetical protein
MNRKDFCQELLARHARSASMGSATLDELLIARYAVIVGRDDDGWVLAAGNKQAVAEIELGCLVSTYGYDEWVVEVWCIGRQRRLSYIPRVVVWIDDVAVEGALPPK